MVSKIFYKILQLVTFLITFLIFITGCKDEEIVFSEDFDISFPEFAITGFSPDTAQIASKFTITGTNFNHIFSVRVGEANVRDYKIIHDTIGYFNELSGKTEYVDSIHMTLPRRILKGPVVIENVFDYRAETKDIFVPLYPPVGVFVFPREIERERRFTITGRNIDLIQAIRLVGEKTNLTIPVRDENATETEITLLTVGLTIPDSSIRMHLLPLSSDVRILTPAGGISPVIKVIDPKPFDPIPPMMLWDFETDIPFFDRTNVQFGANPETGVNLAGVKNIRGNYYTVKLDRVPVTPETNRGASWAYMGDIRRVQSQDGKTLDLGIFNDPHITYLVNTNGNMGYFQLELLQNGTAYGTHRMLRFQYRNYGWEWLSFRLSDLLWEKWRGDGPAKPDVHGELEYVMLGFTTGDILSGSYFEISIDEMMFTDGPSVITDTLFLFEDGQDRFTALPGVNSVFESSVGTTSVSSFEGNAHQHVFISNVSKSEEHIGELRYNGPFTNPAFMNAPHVTFWVNTGNRRGFLQLIAHEGGERFIRNFGEINTNGAWKRFSVNLRAETVHHSGGTRKINFSGLTAVSILVTTGSAQPGDQLEVNIDYVTFSEGPAY